MSYSFDSKFVHGYNTLFLNMRANSFIIDWSVHEIDRKKMCTIILIDENITFIEIVECCN